MATSIISATRCRSAGPRRPQSSRSPLCEWLERKGLKELRPMNKGGRQEVAGIDVAMVHADHSSSVVEEGRTVYVGEPVGFVLGLENGQSIYYAGDTALFGDMRLIKELYAPEIAFLPIGDHFTMGPEAAALAAQMLGVRQIVPMHFGTFPLLTGTPGRLRQLATPLGIEVLTLAPGQTSQ